MFDALIARLPEDLLKLEIESFDLNSTKRTLEIWLKKSNRILSEHQWKLVNDFLLVKTVKNNSKKRVIFPRHLYLTCI